MNKMESTTAGQRITEDELVSERWARDVPFLTGEQSNPAPQLAPPPLIRSLAQSGDARVCMALIPLLLRHPNFFDGAEIADQALSGQPGQLYLRFYYTAAVILQKKYRVRLNRLYGEQVRLPDLFSGKLGLSLDENADENLKRLAKRHQTLSGQHLNWFETYEHGANSFVSYVENFR